MPDGTDGGEKPPKDEELDDEVQEKSYPLAEGSTPIEIEGREISKIVLYPHGAPAPQDNNELAALLTKKESELDKKDKLLEKMKAELTETKAKLTKFEEKAKENEEKEKTSMADEFNELCEQVGLDKIEKPEDLSAEAIEAKLESAKGFIKKLGETPGKPKPKTKQELADEGDKDELKKKKRLEMFGHEDPLGTKPDGGEK